MAEKNEQNMKDAVEQFMHRYRLQSKVDETHLIQHWPEIVGEFVARYTDEIKVREDKIIVRVNSSVIKHQILMMQETIISNINQYMGYQYITALVVY